MKLSKIKYQSAVFFGVLAFVMFLVVGLFSLFYLKPSLETAALSYNAIDPDTAAQLSAQASVITPLQMLLMVPLQSGIAVYLFFLVAILIYNFVARKYPISWETKK